MMHLNVDDLNISFSFRHIRDTDFEIRDDITVTDVTVCDFLINGAEFSGLAACAEGDKFVKETGRKIALKRALEKTCLTKEIRGQVWDKYRNRIAQ